MLIIQHLSQACQEFCQKIYSFLYIMYVVRESHTKTDKILNKKAAKKQYFLSYWTKQKKFLIRNAKLSCRLSGVRCQFRWCEAYPSCKSLICRQGTRPRPVGDTGSVSWRSGQNCAKWITSKQIWVPQVEGGPRSGGWYFLNCKLQMASFGTALAIID